MDLIRRLGVNDKTVWAVDYKPLQMVLEREQTRRLSGRVKADDAYMGGKRGIRFVGVLGIVLTDIGFEIAACGARRKYSSGVGS